MTKQNESMAVKRWEYCIYATEEERGFFKNYFGSMLEKKGLGDLNIVVWDYNRDIITDRRNIILKTQKRQNIHQE